MGQFQCGIAHPRYVGLIKLSCKICGNYFDVEAKQRDCRKLCRHCSSKYRKEFLPLVGMKTRFKKGEHVGEKHFKWKGGKYAKYGLSEKGYKEIIEFQNNKCAICDKKQKKRLSIDHDHKTQKVRGLLCFRCNFGMGWFQEDILRIERMLNYLRTDKDWRDL